MLVVTKKLRFDGWYSPDHTLYKFLDINHVDFGDSYQKSDLALQVAIAINRLADSNELILLDEELELEGRIPQALMAILILKEIRINRYLGALENKIRYSRIVIRSTISYQDLLKGDAVYALAFSPNVSVHDVLSGPMHSSLLKPKILSRAGLVKVQKYLPIPTETDPFDTRHNHSSVLGVFQLYRFARYFRKINVELTEKYPEPQILPETGLSSTIRDRLFLYRFDLPKPEIKLAQTRLSTLIHKIHEQQQFSKRKIVLIDDEAEKLYQGEKLSVGWCSALNTILFSKDMVVDGLKEMNLKIPDNADVKLYAESLISYLKKISPTCLLLDARLTQKETEKNAKVYSGMKMLKYFRKAFPTLPIIMITSTLKTWRHNEMLTLGADAIWVKEGLDETRNPLQSYHNVLRLLELISRVGNKKYQTIARAGLIAKQIEESQLGDSIFWWQKKSMIAWPNGNVNGEYRKFYNSSATPKKVQAELPLLLGDAMTFLRLYLRITELEFDESEAESIPNTSAYESFLAKNIVIQMSKVIELIHGQEMGLKSEDRVNARIIGGIPKLPVLNKKVDIVRGDWIAFALYQLRNECAHYFTEVHYSFSGSGKSPRSLVYVVAHILAYLSNPYQPYHSDLDEDFPWDDDHINRKNRLLAPNYLNNLFAKYPDNLSLQEHLKIYKEILNPGK